MSGAGLVTLAFAAKKLNFSVRTLHARRRKDLGLVDAPPPPGGHKYRWVTRESVEAAAAHLSATRNAIRQGNSVLIA